MLGKATILLLVVTTARVNAAYLAQFVPQDLNARTVNTVGGWSLAQTATGTCPADAPQCGAQWCCPNTLDCIHTGAEDIAEVCCPSDKDCSATFTANPSCADTSWSLWNATKDTSWAAEYFCCLQGQFGLQNGYCIDSANATTSSATAILLGSGTGPVKGETSISSTPPTSTPEFSTTAVSQTMEVATTPVPSPILEPISTGPPTVPPPHSSFSSYSGQGDLLQGYCVTPAYVLLDGPTALWAPIVGCGGDKTDCCPYAPQTSSTTITVVSIVTVDTGPSDATNGPYAGPAAYPTPASSNQATLAHCPGDYVSVSGGCCPSGYQLWNAPLGGQVPCYSSLSSSGYLVPAVVPVTNYGQQFNITGAAASSSTIESNEKPTSAVINIVYAAKFPVQPSSGLSNGAKAGIGVGASLGAIAIAVLSILLYLRARKHKKTLTAIQQAEGQGANAQSQKGISEAISHFPTGKELHHTQVQELQGQNPPVEMSI